MKISKILLYSYKRTPLVIRTPCIFIKIFNCWFKSKYGLYVEYIQVVLYIVYSSEFLLWLMSFQSCKMFRLIFVREKTHQVTLNLKWAEVYIQLISASPFSLVSFIKLGAKVYLLFLGYIQDSEIPFGISCAFNISKTKCNKEEQFSVWYSTYFTTYVLNIHLGTKDLK